MALGTARSQCGAAVSSCLCARGTLAVPPLAVIGTASRLYSLGCLWVVTDRYRLCDPRIANPRAPKLVTRTSLLMNSSLEGATQASTTSRSAHLDR